MLPIVLLASISRCISPDLCPSDAELIGAVRAQDNAMVSEISRQFAEENPDQITLVHSERILGVSDVICGDEVPYDSLAITCKFTVRYPSQKVFLVALLIRSQDGWKIEDQLGVSRRRK